MKELSVVIVTYNSEPDIYGCLDALFAHNDIGDALEVIVVDNNSTAFAAMREKIGKQYGEKVTVLSNSRNGGYGQGNNIGIKHASAPIIMIMNPDVRLDSMALREIVQDFRFNPKTAMYGLKQLTMSGRKAPSFFFINSSNAWERSIGAFLANKFDWYRSTKMCFSGACFCIRKNVIETIGGFDENIFMYGEEHDLHYRIRQAFPSSVNVYNRHLHYKHRIEKRDFSAAAYRKRIESNMYIFQKRHLDPLGFIRTEDKCIRIVSFLKRMVGDHSNLEALNHQRHILQEYVGLA